MEELNDMYVQGAQSILTGFTILLSAIETNDPALTQTAIKHITEG